MRLSTIFKKLLFSNLVSTFWPSHMATICKTLGIVYSISTFLFKLSHLFHIFNKAKRINNNVFLFFQVR